LALVLAAAVVVHGIARADWPHWRGDGGNGVSLTAKPPVVFGPEQNVRWKCEIPGRGSSSPVVIDDRVFVTTAVPVEGEGGQLDFRLICIDRDTGRSVWSRSCVKAVPHEGTHETNGFASASPCTDGDRVYAHFGSRGLHCFTAAGDHLWSRDFGDMTVRHGFGEGSSPVLTDELVIVPWDHEGPSKLFALEKRTGKTVWEVPRDEPTCWATPLVVTDRDGTNQVVMNGQNAARGYELATGRELWRCGGQTERPCSSALSAEGKAFIGSGFRGSFLGAFDLAGRGDLAGGPRVLWTKHAGTPDVASPLLSDGRLYYYKEKTGLLTCVDATTGEAFYETVRVPGVARTYASPVAAGGHVYLTDRSGRITVIEDGPSLKVVAENDVGEGVDATPAPVGASLFVRGEKHLFRFAED
jgi:outer membrane protein assembly factor BamB